MSVNLQSTAIRQKPNNAVKNNDLTPIINDLIAINDAPAATPPGGGTAVGILGAGTINKLAKFATNTTTIADSQIFDDGTSVGIGTITPDADTKVQIVGLSSTFSDYNLKTQNLAGTSFIKFRNDGYLRIEQNAFDVFGKTAGNDILNLYQQNGEILVSFKGTNDDTVDFYKNNAVSTRYMDGNWGIGVGAATPVAIVEIASTTSGLVLSRMTATQASAVTKIDGMMIYVTDTNGTFTSLGFWGVENNVWVKL